MNQNLRQTIEANIKNAAERIKALNAQPARSLLDAWGNSWALLFLTRRQDGTPNHAEKARELARQCAEPYNQQDPTCRLALACQRIAEAVSAALQTPADEPRARRLITEANHILTTLTP